MIKQTERTDWVDYTKGFCIIFVVMMHSTLGVEAAAGREGFMHYLVTFAKPFRMPDFFMISGLFLSRVIDHDWRTFLDRKVVHFAYFYVLWATIQFCFKAPGQATELSPFEVLQQYLLAFVQPFGTLWFIYMLPIVFVCTKLTRRVPPLIIWLFAASLQIATIDTGAIIVDEFAGRFVYFYTGYLLAPRIFAFAAGTQSRPLPAMTGLLLWGLVNGLLAFHGYADLPFVSLGLGLSDACAVISVSALLATSGVFAPLRYCGRHSIVIYLAFFLPMAAARMALLKTGLIAAIDVISVIVTICGVLAPLALFWLVRDSSFRFLFERPRIFRLRPEGAVHLQPAE